MLLYFIAFVRPQPIAVRRGERPERGRQRYIDLLTTRDVCVAMNDSLLLSQLPIPTSDAWLGSWRISSVSNLSNPC